MRRIWPRTWEKLSSRTDMTVLFLMIISEVLDAATHALAQEYPSRQLLSSSQIAFNLVKYTLTLVCSRRRFINSRRTLLIALSLNNKLGFVVDFSLKPQGTNSNFLNLYIRNNNIDIFWILNVARP